MTLSGLSDNGQNALWAVFIIQSIAALVYGFSGFRLPADRRDHFLVTTAIVATAALSYYAMATGLGHTMVDIGSKKEAVTRPIFYARYIDWSITTPLLLVDVLLMAKLPIVVAGWAIFADLAMVITGLIGGLDGSEYRWGWFVIGCFFMLAIFVVLFLDGPKYVERRDSNLLSFYNSVVLGLVVLWTAYPIVWALGEGTQYISSDTEAYLYGILDVLAKVGWGGFILYNNDMLYTSYTKGLESAGKVTKKIKKGIFSALGMGTSLHSLPCLASAPATQLRPATPSFGVRVNRTVQASSNSTGIGVKTSTAGVRTGSIGVHACCKSSRMASSVRLGLGSTASAARQRPVRALARQPAIVV